MVSLNLIISCSDVTLLASVDLALEPLPLAFPLELFSCGPFP